ncbi:hypothetical protein DBR11_10915 [Pedobacter sp. HMWF019]|uniref:FecR family protein n=1 Tax=Pedobacter sp. HMWF019 TaxID=2056856 RepID=UPI000D35F886|nr:FecR family protein [Pedobacter sp. HMWF019]PTT00074.1 hypothetical protein DBR11_10915 [Pedobacter sp. HMWF019]
MEQNNRVEFLIDKYLHGQCSEEEKKLVEQFYLTTLKSDQFPMTEPTKDIKLIMWNYISSSTSRKKPIRLWSAIAVAASVALIGLYVFLTPIKNGDDLSVAKSFLAATNQATLTLADGKVLELSGEKSTLIVNGEVLTYNDGSPVSDQKEDQPKNSSNHSLMASTPKGGVYTFVLPDGSKVWLNADSRIRFPERFAGLTSRTVELEGEAYFEVTHDKLHPFIVSTPKQKVKVLGTHFNINAYQDEPVEKTALIQGSVNINDKAVLKPGEESIVASRTILKVAQADLTAEMAWKNGLFVFNDAPLDVIMRQISKWYNVNIIYKGDLTNETYNGTIDRRANLSRILNILKKGGVRFEIKDNNLLVTP